MSPAGVSGTPDTVDEACRGGTMSRIQYLSSSTTLGNESAEIPNDIGELRGNARCGSRNSRNRKTACGDMTFL